MKSVVIELQRDALSRDILITDLCRKAYVIARKLHLTEFENWLRLELEGYSRDNDIPEYREVKGEVKAWSQVHGWQPIYIESAQIAETLSKTNNNQRIAEIENLSNSASEKSISLQIPFTAEEQNIICEGIGRKTQVTLMISESALVRVIDAVRNIILNWALQLEEDGILGEGMTFSDDEKSQVVKHSYNVNNFYQEVTGSQIQQSSTYSSQDQHINDFSMINISEFLDTMKKQNNLIELDDITRRELGAEISTIEIQATSPNPKEGIVKESMSSIKRILEGAGGGVAAQLLIQLGRLF